MMRQHYVTFYSPGTFMAEQTRKPIEAWDVEAACAMASDVKERHGALPYGFVFTTHERQDDELNSKETARSPLYHLGGRVETLEEVEARGDPAESILRANMRANGYDRIVVNENSWRWTQPLLPDDVVLDWSPEQAA